MEKIALFPGSFDPFTMGHLDIIERGAELFDLLYIGVFVNTNKHSLFPIEEKVRLVSETVGHLENVRVISQEKELTVNVASRLEAKYLLRGIRNMKDFEYEREIMEMNRHLNPEVETVFLVSKSEFTHISSSLIKEVLLFNGDVQKYLPQNVYSAIRKRGQK